MKVIEQLDTLSEERFFEIYDSLSKDGFGPLDNEVAKSLKFRPQAIRKLPMDKRARRAKSILKQSKLADLAYELFGTYLMTKHKQLVIDFLDGTGVEHEEGMLKGGDEAKPDVSKIGSVVQELDSKYAPADVTLYLAIAAEQWPALDEVDSIWRMRL